VRLEILGGATCLKVPQGGSVTQERSFTNWLEGFIEVHIKFVPTQQRSNGPRDQTQSRRQPPSIFSSCATGSLKPKCVPSSFLSSLTHFLRLSAEQAVLSKALAQPRENGHAAKTPVPGVIRHALINLCCLAMLKTTSSTTQPEEMDARVEVGHMLAQISVHGLQVLTWLTASLA
jgi:hypothetical protein